MAHDVHPATMLVHVPSIANHKKLQIPLMLLPGRSSIELGNALNIKRTSIIMFVKSSTSSSDGGDNEDGDDNDDPIDSFVEFAKTELLTTDEGNP